MKRTKRIISFLFFALMGVILSLSIGVAPFAGMLLGFVSYLPIQMPSGVFAMGVESGTDVEDKLLDKIDKKVSKAVTEYNRGFINEDNLKARLEPIEKHLNDLKEKGVTGESFTKLTDAFDKLAEDVSKLSLQRVENSKSNVEKFKESLKEAVKKLKENGAGFVKVEKTVGTMSNSASVDGTMPQAERESGFTNVPRQMFVIREASNVFPTSSTTVEWVEQQNIEGGAGMTAEGAAKTQLDWEYKVNSANVRKITSYVKITEEMLNDIDGMRGEIDGNLMYQLMLKEEAQLLTGDGNAPNLNGVITGAESLDLAALANTIANPNYMDALGAAITQIRVNGKGEFVANRIFLNPSDIFVMIHAAKATTAEYVNPITVVPNVDGRGLPSQVYIWGVPVVASDSITAGNFLVADMTKYHIRDYEGVRIEVGYENDDFTKNLVTIRGEKRLATYKKTNHDEAFIYESFADAITFLTAAS